MTSWFGWICCYVWYAHFSFLFCRFCAHKITTHFSVPYNSLRLSTLALVQHYHRFLCLFYTAAHRTTQLSWRCGSVTGPRIIHNVLCVCFCITDDCCHPPTIPHRCYYSLRPLPGTMASYSVEHQPTSSMARHRTITPCPIPFRMRN